LDGPAQSNRQYRARTFEQASGLLPGLNLQIGQNETTWLNRQRVMLAGD
jgi:hypothetical protein